MPLKKRKKPKAKKRKVVKRKPVKRKAAKRKPLKRKPAKKKVAKKSKKSSRRTGQKKAAALKDLGKQVGIVTHYFPHVMAAVVKVTSPISTGDTLRIKGHTSDFTQTINSMQVDHVPVEQAKKGDEVGLLVRSRVRQHDTVYKV